jgi:hypothetical protein
MQLCGHLVLELKDSRMGFGGDIVSGVAKERGASHWADLYTVMQYLGRVITVVYERMR